MRVVHHRAVVEGRHELADEIVAGIVATGLHGLGGVRVELDGGVDDVVGDVLGVVGSGDHLVGQVLQPVIFRRVGAQHLADEGHGQRLGDVGHDVARALVDDGIHERTGHLAHMGLVGRHLARAEPAGHSTPLVGVRRVVAVDHRRLRLSVRTRPDGTTGEQRGLALGPADVVDLGERPDAVDVAIDGLVVPDPGQGRIRIPLVHVAIENVHLHCRPPSWLADASTVIADRCARPSPPSEQVAGGFGRLSPCRNSAAS